MCVEKKKRGGGGGGGRTAYIGLKFDFCFTSFETLIFRF